MKNLITAAACLAVLLAFLVQFTHSQIFHVKLTAADQAVAAFCQTVKQEGCVSLENEKRLKEELAELFQCAEEKVIVEGGRSPVLRGTVISCRVSVEVSGVVALASFWNLSEEENRFRYQVSRSVTSEYTGREP